MERGANGGGWTRWLTGCGAAIVVAVAALLVVGVRVTAPFRRAVDLSRQIEAGPGGLEGYVPPADGVIPAQRVRAFLAVRAELARPCEEIAEATAQLERMESFDGRDDVPRWEVVHQALATTRAAMGVGTRIGRFFEVRDQALLDQGMGYGEYAFLYLSAYHDRLAYRGRDHGIARSLSPRGEAVMAFRPLLERWRLTVTEPDLEGALGRELEAGGRDRHRLPWQDGLPAPLAASLAPFRVGLDAGFCPEAVGLELGMNHPHAGGVVVETR